MFYLYYVGNDHGWCLLIFHLFSRQVCKQFFPDLSVGFEDPRVRLHVDDGMLKIGFILWLSYLLFNDFYAT